MQITRELRAHGAWLLLASCLLIAGCQTPGDAGMVPAGQSGQRGGDAAQRAQVAGQQIGDRQEISRLRTELAFNYFQRGQLSVALDEVRVAIAADPANATAFNVLGLINMDLGENTRADEAFRRALSIAPEDSDTLNNYGWFLCQTKRERESIPRFLQALKNPLYSTPAKPYLNAGICSQRLGDEAAAEDYYRKALSLDTTNPAVLLRLSDLYFRRGDIEQSRLYLDRVHRNFEPSAESLWLALRVERRAGDRGAEASFAAQLRRRFPESRETLLLQQGRFE
jgi:type IV pilus assembly protein PilF